MAVSLEEHRIEGAKVKSSKESTINQILSILVASTHSDTYAYEKHATCT